MVASLPPTSPTQTIVTQSITSQPSQPNLNPKISTLSPSPTMTNQNPNTHPNAEPNAAQLPVSPNNPCPFLRMLVANGELPNGESPISTLDAVIQRVVHAQDLPAQPVPSFGIKSVASTANGLSPRQVAHNIRHGVKLDNLRYHIFDKQGSGSRILDEQANFVPSELARLASFGSLKLDKDGNSEIGLNEQEIKAMMDANFARAKGHRRAIDRPMMNGEFPILLKVMGKQGKNERYLAVADVERLFKERRLPERMEQRLGKS